MSDRSRALQRSGPLVYVAPVTPMKPDGELDLAQVPLQYAVLRARGADGFYLCGGTGEGMLLDAIERERVVEAWRDAAGSDVPLFVHVGCPGTREARRLARHAANCGAAGISSVAPPVYAAADLGQLVAFQAEIAEAAPGVPYFFYHNGGSPGVRVTGQEFLAAAERSIPTLAGIKFTHEDLLDLSLCLRFGGGRYEIFYGKDEFLLGAHATGATRFIGGSFNVVAPLVKRALAAFAAGDADAAQAWQHKLVDVIVVLRKFGGLSAVKATMGLLGIPCGPTRLPLRSVRPEQQGALFDQLRAVWPEVADPAREARPAPAMAAVP